LPASLTRLPFLTPQERDAKLNETMDELANITALFNEAKSDMEQAKADKEELEELREMRSDIDRKDKQNAMIIENQVRGGVRARAGLRKCWHGRCGGGEPAPGQPAGARGHECWRDAPCPARLLTRPPAPCPRPLRPRRPSGWRSWRSCTARST
jgi:hypothetical protein